MSVKLSEFQVVRSSVVTERATLLKEKFNQYVFKVNPDSSKGQIRDAIKKIFSVDVQKIQTSNFSGKLRRLAQGRPQGRRNDWKRAIVTLKPGQEIKFEQETGTTK